MFILDNYNINHLSTRLIASRPLMSDNESNERLKYSISIFIFRREIRKRSKRVDGKSLREFIRRSIGWKSTLNVGRFIAGYQIAVNSIVITATDDRERVNQSTSFFPARWIVQFDKTKIFILFVPKIRHVYSFMSIPPPVFYFSFFFFSWKNYSRIIGKRFSWLWKHGENLFDYSRVVTFYWLTWNRFGWINL